VIEIMPFNEEVDDHILADSSLSVVKKSAEKIGFVPMIGDASHKVLSGLTSLDAAMRVVDFTARL
jgi:type II secretory ATPase GspE/PulE/Tfp pilus assembly ATPase PilB-like protein